MIIETRDDVVSLSGSLHKNQWLTIRAAANLLLQNHPEGIIVDCADLQDISEDGAKTFLEAVRDIEAARSRIVVANLPEQVLGVLKKIPGVRSQLPVAQSVEEARASLKSAVRSSVGNSPTAAGRAGSTLLVPLVPNVDLSYGAALAAALARPARDEVRLVYFLEVARHLPLNSPLPDAEREAQTLLERAQQYARPYNVVMKTQLMRVREAGDGILATIKSESVDRVVIAAASQKEGAESYNAFDALVDLLLHRAPCEVVIGRQRRYPTA